MSDDTTKIRVARARAVVRAVYISGETLLGEAQRRAPKDEGTLRASGTLGLAVNGSRIEGEGALAAATNMAVELARAGTPLKVEAIVTFATVYAARQHEELDWHHNDGEAKYLEKPLGELAPRFETILGKAIRAAS